MTDYVFLCRQLQELVREIPYEVANFANAAALLWETLPDINWAGFYKWEQQALVLYPFQGKPACIRIAPGRGVCGMACSQNKTLNVPDVHAFPGHIACDEASRSEIVIPLHRAGKVWGVMDIDSPVKNRFSSEDQDGLERFAELLEKTL